MLSSLRRGFKPLRLLQMTRSCCTIQPDIVNCNQGDKVGSVFTNEEMNNRLTKLRSTMEQTNVEACVFTSIHNILYYSGLVIVPMGREYALVVTDNDATIVAAAVDYGQPWRRSYCDVVTYTDWKRDNCFRAVKQLVGDRGKVGLELDHVNFDNYQKFRATLPKADLLDVSKTVMRQRMVKTDEEIAVIRNGAKIADVGAYAALDVLKENVPEYEMTLASTSAMVREIAKYYPDPEQWDTWSWLLSDINTDGGHNRSTSRRIQKGDILSLNCFPMIAGYFSALERTLFFDHVSDAALKIWEINCKVHKRGLEIVKPGAKCKDIALELNEIYAAHDLLKCRTFGYGHSFGAICYYYGREGALELREDIETILQPNMVISMEPMVVIPEGTPGAGGYREHDILVINENGAENITVFPYGPEHNVIKA